MRVVVVGAETKAQELAAELGSAGLETLVWSGSGAEEASVSGLAGQLVAIEEGLAEERPGAVVLADASDAALAATITATKLELPVVAAPGARSEGSNGRVIAQLTAELPTDLAAWSLDGDGR